MLRDDISLIPLGFNSNSLTFSEWNPVVRLRYLTKKSKRFRPDRGGILSCFFKELSV
ncbi:hypothetical protein HMPREF9439_00076 [Parasutterella excrementihominis YIT 11859]|uniref:Uncharacterized protein n=1 Tax=Parasutterella excrementihominis YIT 11859 TaxID=762966 RepID=F3QGN8_9BURK|nr:hypothetical protein HMPREF9439_00076 [Parasutterella excrementihominis YIT 11859]